MDGEFMNGSSKSKPSKTSLIILNRIAEVLFLLACYPVALMMITLLVLLFDSRVTLSTMHIKQPELIVLAFILIVPLYFLRRYTRNELKKMQTQSARKQRQSN
jgi:hypothetical protein